MKAVLFLALVFLTGSCHCYKPMPMHGSCTDSTWTIKQEYGDRFESRYGYPARQHVPYCFMNCPELKAKGYCNYFIASVCSSDTKLRSLQVRDHCKKTCEHRDCQAKPNNGCSDRWGSACYTYKSYYGCNYSSIRKGCANSCNACPRNCEWSSWQEGQCDKTCGGGKRKVSRTKLVQERNGGYCYGRSYKIERCNINTCQTPTDCKWSGWEYGQCTKTCGGGKRTNYRKKLVQHSNGGRPCTGSTWETESCNTHSCPIDKCRQQPCPPAFPNLDTSHRYMIEHGDVCRNEKVHGYNVGWTCPCGCVSVGNRHPWCVQNGTPCRIN